MTIIDFLAKFGLSPRKVASTKGGEYACACPGCGGVDRFRVWPEQNQGQGSYWCRQCNRGGDAIQFLRDFEGLSFRQACERLGRPLPASTGLRMPRQAEQKAFEPAPAESPDELWASKAGKFAIWAYKRLFEHQDVIDWLAGRGIREESFSRFGLGWNPGEKGKDVYRAREAWGLSRVENEKGRARPLWLPKGLVIPCLHGGNVERLRIRRPAPEFGPRYYVVPGSSMRTMMIEPARICLVVVESELDAILIAQEAWDLVGAVGLGSSGARPDLATTEMLRAAACVLVALDFDQAGASASTWWRKNFPDSVRWPVPAGKDPAEAFKAGVDIRSWIQAGLPAALRGEKL